MILYKTRSENLQFTERKQRGFGRRSRSRAVNITVRTLPPDRASGPGLRRTPAPPCRMSVPLWCLSFRQPYAGLVLDGVKTLESRWRPLLAPLQNHTLAVHIAWRDWEGEEWREVLSGRLGMDQDQIRALLRSGEGFGRGVVAGLVDVGATWLCPASLQGEELWRLERSAVLIGLQEKHLTQLTNPRWLKEPLSARGARDLWTVEIPAELLP